MRKLAIIASMILLLGLWGCATNDLQESALSTAVTTVPTTTSPVADTTAPAETTVATTVPETTVAETTVPETTVPETTVAETTVPETTVPETTAAPTEHVHNYEKEKVAPTCTQKGYTLYTCSCGDSYKDDEKKAKGHNVENWETLSREGIELQQEGTCSRCGEKQTRTILDYPNGNYKAGVINGASMTQEELDACAVKIHEVIQPWMGLSNYEKLKAAFMYLQENVRYKQDLSDDTSNLYGAMIKGYADCWGYATAFQYLCHAMGFECYFVLPEGTWHSWNIVGLEGNYYHVDAQVGYFLLTADEIGRSYNQSKFPPCDKVCPYLHGMWWGFWAYCEHENEETEPIVTEPIETEPIVTDPIETDPIETEPTESVPATDG